MKDDLIKKLLQYKAKEDISTSELANRLKFQYGTVFRWLKEKKIKGIYAGIVIDFLENNGKTETYDHLKDRLLPILEKYRLKHNLTNDSLAQEMKVQVRDLYKWKNKGILKQAPARIVGSFLEKKGIKL